MALTKARKNKHGWLLTVFVILILVMNLLLSGMYFFGGDIIQNVVQNFPNWGGIVLGVLSILNIGFALALLFKKRWGLYGFAGLALVILIVNLNIIGLRLALVGLVGPLLLLVLVRPNWRRLYGYSLSKIALLAVLSFAFGYILQDGMRTFILYKAIAKTIQMPLPVVFYLLEAIAAGIGGAVLGAMTNSKLKVVLFAVMGMVAASIGRYLIYTFVYKPGIGPFTAEKTALWMIAGIVVEFMLVGAIMGALMGAIQRDWRLIGWLALAGGIGMGFSGLLQSLPMDFVESLASLVVISAVRGLVDGSVLGLCLAYTLGSYLSRPRSP